MEIARAREYIFTASLSIFSFSENIYVWENMYISENICSPQFSRYFPFHPFPQYTYAHRAPAKVWAGNYEDGDG